MPTTFRLAKYFFALVIGAPLPFVAAQTYSIADLGTFPGGTVSQGNGVNDCGQVVGYARFANYNAHAFFWTKTGGLHDLGAIPPKQNKFSVAQAINSHGFVVGYSTYNNDPYGLTHPVLWVDGNIGDLGTLPGSDDAQAMAINDNGAIAGFSVQHAFLWTPLGGMQDLGALSGGYSQGLGINSSGTVVGYSNTADSNWHAIVWTAATGMQPLPYLFPSDTSASANGINRYGQIAGGVSEGYSGEYAVLWDGDGNVENLGLLPGQGWSTAFAINDRAQVVGWSGFTAFIWTRASGMQDLNTLIPSNSGWSLSMATGINNRGQITGQGTINGQQHGFLLAPTDEPSWGCE